MTIFKFFKKIATRLLGEDLVARNAARRQANLLMSSSQVELEDDIERVRNEFQSTADFLSRWLASEIDLSAPIQVDSPLHLQKTRLRKLPGNLTVLGDLNLKQCQRFTGFGPGNLRVKGRLAIGGSAGNTPWIGLPNIEVTTDKRVSQFIAKPSVLAQTPFYQWPTSVVVDGGLSIINCRQCVSLPNDLKVEGGIELVDCGIHALPAKLIVNGDLTINRCPIETLPDELVVEGKLILRHLPIDKLPNHLTVRNGLIIEDCPNLTELPSMLDATSTIVIKRCGLKTIPSELPACKHLELTRLPITTLNFEKLPESLYVSACPDLVSLSSNAVRMNRLTIQGCPNFEKLPEVLRVDTQCRLIELPKVTQLPEKLEVGLRIDITGTPIESVSPDQMITLSFMQRGIPIPAYALFEPEKITLNDIVDQRNAEVRRMMLEQMGRERFFKVTESKVVDQDTDPGGQRRLLAIDSVRGWQMRHFLNCFCPSTDRMYLLGVPSTVSSCHDAAAWLAGFENPDDYKPIIET